MSIRMDLNADLGELPGAEGRASDTAILDAVTSCAIACGGHAGDEAIMETTLREAVRRGVSPGAHPSYPDAENFGRRSLDISAEALGASLRQQIQRLQSVAARIGASLKHVKPHGALYNDAAASASIAQTVAQAVKFSFGTQAALIGPPGSETEKAAIANGLCFYAEGFMDRTYLPDGALMPRSQSGAVLHDTPSRIAQALNIALDQYVITNAQDTLPLSVQTICLHGDSPGAAQTAKAVRAALEAKGVDIRAPDLVDICP